MSINIKSTLGTVNFTDWLHITVTKVPTGSPIVWETWIDVPVSNHNFVISPLDPENYYIRAYDAPTDTALGSLVIEVLVNGLTGEFIFERRYYTVGGAGTYDPADGDAGITDPYLVDKNVTGWFKEQFRYLIPEIEFSFDDTTGNAAMINGDRLSAGEVVCIEIKYEAGNTSTSSGGGLYAGTISVTEATKTLLAADRNKRVRCVGTDSTQVITLPALSSLTAEDGFYFDNACGGKALQVKLLLDGGDRIRFTGFMHVENDMTSIDELAEFWVDRGKQVLIRKITSDYFEIITPYDGINVGERFSGTHKFHPLAIIADGQTGSDALDGDEYPRIWWFINNRVAATHVIVDDNVINTNYTHPAGKKGLWVRHSTLKKFRSGNWQELVEKGLKNFRTYGGDTTRIYDYPGGEQLQAVMNHRHFNAVSTNSSSTTPIVATQSIIILKESDGDFKYLLIGNSSEPTVARSGKPIDDSGASIGNSKNLVDTGGVVFMYRI